MLICPAASPQTQKTLTDASVVFEVLSDDTAATDRVEKLRDRAEVPALKYDIMLEKASHGAISAGAPRGAWITRPQAQGALELADVNLVLPLDDIYQGLSFPPEITA